MGDLLNNYLDFQRKLYLFGGIIGLNQTTNEFWEFDLMTKRWGLLFSHNVSVLKIPLATAGHTAHVVGNEMHILFGYNPFEGYLFVPQIYSFGRYLKKKI